MTTPKTLRELCGAATTGPYFVSHDDKEMDDGGYRAHVASGLAIIDTGRVGDWPIARFCEWPQAELIARLSPEVVMKTYEALIELRSIIDPMFESCAGLKTFNLEQYEAIGPALAKADLALSALDGVTPNQKPQ